MSGKWWLHVRLRFSHWSKLEEVEILSRKVAMMVLFLIVGLVMVIGLVLAIEWLMDWLSLYSDDDLVSATDKPLSPAERRAAAQADFDDVCDDLRWRQRRRRNVGLSIPISPSRPLSG